MQQAPPHPHVILIGPMGAGKTTIGRRIAAALGMPFVDSDDIVEAEQGSTGAEIAQREGVGRLHEIELEVFLSAARSSVASVICPAESVVDDPTGRLVLSEQVTFWLDADHATLRSRQAEGSHRRSMGAQEFALRRASRDPHLATVCVQRIDTSRTGIDEVVADLCEVATNRLRRS